MISVLIATQDDADRLGIALRPLVRAAIDGVVREVIVIDGGSADATLELADEAGCRILRHAGDAQGRLVAGAAEARSDWLLLLDPSAWLAEGWEAQARAHIERHPDRAACFPAAGEGLLHRLGLSLGIGPRAPLARLTPRSRIRERGPAVRLKAPLLRPVDPR